MPEPKDIKVDGNNTWLRGSLVWSLLLLTATIASSGTLLWYKSSTAAEIIEKTMAREFTALREEMREVRDEVRKLGNDTVSVRQFVLWIEQFRVKNPSTPIPDLPR